MSGGFGANSTGIGDLATYCGNSEEQKLAVVLSSPSNGHVSVWMVNVMEIRQKEFLCGGNGKECWPPKGAM